MEKLHQCRDFDMFVRIEGKLVKYVCDQCYQVVYAKKY